MVATTPKKISAEVRAFCKEISPKYEPVYVPVEPDPSAILDACFENNRQKIERDGGEQIYGWQIWLWPNVFIEAEHHGVWKSPEDKLVDLTPKRELEPRILFVPDPQRKYDYENHRRIDNVRKALTQDRDLTDFFEIKHQIFELYERGSEHSGLWATMNLSELTDLEQRAAVLYSDLVSKFIRPNDKCPCGSAKKYKKCHGR